MSHSVSKWLAGLRAGDAEAAQELWNRYANRLVEVARHRLDGSPRAATDEEDIALSVFDTVCRGAEAGRFRDIVDRDDLWWLLLTITRQKVVDYVRRETTQRRGSGRVRQETAIAAAGSRGFSLDQLIGTTFTAEYWVVLEEQHQRLLGLLRDDRLRRIAVRRIEGFTVAEIAEDLTISSRSVERKLRLIRDRWSQELAADE